MRHRVAGKTLGRDTNQRKGLYKNLVSELMLHGAMQTTIARAKAIRGVADHLIAKAKKGDLASRRVLLRFFGNRLLVNRVVDEVAPVMKSRVSGFTRIIRLENRQGDDATIVRMELVEKPVVRQKAAAQKPEAKKPEVKKEEKAPVGKEKKPKTARKAKKPRAKKAV